MARSVVLGGTHRCARCQLAPRWCICDGLAPLDLPLQVEVLIHHREYWRPTSTGRLIDRLIPSARTQVFRHETPPTRDALVQPGRELWVLHPRGEPLPPHLPPPTEVQLLLLDGNWRESLRMLHTVETWGRRVCLPMTGAGRYWLRGVQGPGHYSTIEALLFLMQALGMVEAEAHLRKQFELHVYAGLRARGAKGPAAEYLATSPIRDAFPELLQHLEHPSGRP